jgi:hypothetical protein
MIAYDIRVANGVVRFASVASKLAAAELAFSGPAASEPPAHDPDQPAACFVKEGNGSDPDEPFWHADLISDEAVLPEMPKSAANDYDGSAM